MEVSSFNLQYPIWIWRIQIGPTASSASDFVYLNFWSYTRQKIKGFTFLFQYNPICFHMMWATSYEKLVSKRKMTTKMTWRGHFKSDIIISWIVTSSHRPWLIHVRFSPVFVPTGLVYKILSASYLRLVQVGEFIHMREFRIWRCIVALMPTPVRVNVAASGVHSNKVTVEKIVVTRYLDSITNLFFCSINENKNEKERTEWLKI